MVGVGVVSPVLVEILVVVAAVVYSTDGDCWYWYWRCVVVGGDDRRLRWLVVLVQLVVMMV